MTGNEFLIKVNEPHVKSFCQRSARSGSCLRLRGQSVESFVWVPKDRHRLGADSHRLENEKHANQDSIDRISNHVSPHAV